MKTRLSILFTIGTLLFAFSTSMVASPYFVCINGNTFYYAAPTGTVDFQGRSQYKASCVSLTTGDRLTCYDAGSQANWHISVIDPYGAFDNFANNGSAFVCKSPETYDIYIKIAYNDDMWYIEESASGCIPAEPRDPSKDVYDGSVPANCPDVMLQAFYWDSYQDQGYGRTKWIDLLPQAEEMGKWFDLIWLPPSARATGGTGYLPRQYCSQDCDWGTKGNLLSMINTFHANGARVVADVVINHASNMSGWCNFYPENFGAFGSFNPDMSWICSTDEAFYDNHCTDAAGAPDDGYGPEANYEAGRDWDHTSSKVRAMFKAYLQWLRTEIGYDGFRYDYCKGFHNSHINEYNTAAEAYFSVMEYWDGDVNVLQSHIADAGMNTLTFDFATKYTAFNNGIAGGNYGGCKGAGLPGAGKSRYAVTFLDSHDSFQRDDNEFMGKNNSMKTTDSKNKVMQCNAYLLSMPGIPCIFYPHWVTFKDDLKQLINARYKAGVHSESAVSDETGSGFYKATITGTNGSIRLLLGPNSGYNSTPSGYTLAAKGPNWGVYYKMTTQRGDKCDNRTPIGDNTAIPAIEEQRPQADKIIKDGQLFLISNGHWYNALGQQVK